MKQKIKLSSAIIIIMIAINSCKKDAVLIPPSNMNSFFAANGVAVQSFTIDASQFQIVKGSKGTKIKIPAGSFVTQNNVSVTSGNVNIELREIFSKKDMILSGAPTYSNKLPLISGGEIYLNATKDGQELKLSPSSNVTIGIPTYTPDSNMQEFYTSNLSATDPSPNSDWNPADSSSVTIIQDTLSIYPYYIIKFHFYYFRLDSLKWINCDYFMQDSAPKTDVIATVGEKFDHSNCVVFLSVDGIKSVAPIRIFGGYYSHIYKTYNFPIGKAVTFIAISEIDGQYYSAFVSTTLVNNHNETLDLQPTTLSEINIALENLP